MDDVYGNLEEYNLTKKTKLLIMFHDMTVDMVTELFLEGRKLNISLIFKSQILFESVLSYKTKCNIIL